MAMAVNSAGYFRDLFFVVIVVSIIAVTNLLDNCVRKMGSLNAAMQPIVIMALGWYLVLLIYGTFHFSTLAQNHGPIRFEDFIADYRVIAIALITTFLTEMLICFAE